MTEPKAFHGVVKPAIVQARGLKPGPARIVEIPEKDRTETPLMRVEAARQWCLKQGDPLGKNVADILVEQAIRIQAVKSYIQCNFPQGQIRDMIEKILEGKLTAIPVDPQPMPPKK